MNPYEIEGPAVISFSGGRTSGYMLRKVLDAHNGQLPKDVHVIFSDTGQERPETYTFVRDCANKWGVDITWVERPGQFTQLITDKKYLPNVMARFCTQELKLTPMRKWMLARGYDHWDNAVGIRADEPRRIARIKESAEKRKDRWDIVLPLATAGVGLPDVLQFWGEQAFDLTAKDSNCTGCFLKGYGALRNVARDEPEILEWWAKQEERIGATFRKDRPSYRAMLNQPDLFKEGMLDEDLIECACTD